MFGKIASGIFQTFQRSTVFIPVRPLSLIFTSTPPTANSVAGGVWSSVQVRNKMRNYWPRPKETKRVKVHGWAKRMSVLSGRKVIMNRILKGRTVLSH